MIYELKVGLFNYIGQEATVKVNGRVTNVKIASIIIIFYLLSLFISLLWIITELILDLFLY